MFEVPCASHVGLCWNGVSCWLSKLVSSQIRACEIRPRTKIFTVDCQAGRATGTWGFKFPAGNALSSEEEADSVLDPAASPRPCVADSDWDSDCGSDSRVAAVVDLTRHRDICARAPAGRCERLHCPGPNCLNILLVRVPRSQPETPCCTCRGPPGPGTTIESVCTAPSHRLGAVR